ncbi:hypothetical protein VB715_02130 [Crocosphaera sp. UHCC 0190]|uniref:hypothetical protein n=1 Tax=Crocosphaera sp. UHCC 0190 TaxID=3110246 RepID=UPI002B1FA8F4|nr:hypothetical protein [Crocosphaera sp. UHCC 0190]MEA5508554.1 hypothetical protein [Crocosphaera sp. UHCC 0190]
MSEEKQPQLSQAELIKLLRTTITQLNNIVTQLTTDSLGNLPPQETIEILVSSTEAIAVSLQVSSPSTKVETLPKTEPEKSEDWEESETDETEEKLPGIDGALPSFNRLQIWWDGVLGGIRSLFPTAISERLSDWVITGVLGVIIVAFLSTSVLLLPQPLSVSKIVQTPSEIPQPKVIETPPQLESPALPEPIKLAPPPGPKLTPEQGLIAAIQQQVTELTNQYPTGLIGTIEANFLASRLIVTLGEQWYELPPKRQDTLANTILKRAQTLDFRKLEMIDDQGTLLARSPVVGDQIVILQRHP